MGEAEQFFHYQHTLDEEEVVLASFYLTKIMFQWFNGGKEGNDG